MVIIGLHNESDLDALTSAARALAFLTVPWSVFELKARRTFHSAVDQIRKFEVVPPIRFFALDEDAEWCQEWLTTLQVPNLTCPIGAGAILWIANGQLLHIVVNGTELTVNDVVARTRFFWPK